jgi:hypothetical protein
MGARSELADYFREQLPDTHLVVDNVRELVIELPVVAAVQLIRTSIEHAAHQPQGAYLQRFDLWVLTPVTDAERADDALDDAADEVLLAIDVSPFLTWETCERQLYPSETNPYPAYKITAAVATTGRK